MLRSILSGRGGSERYRVNVNNQLVDLTFVDSVLRYCASFRLFAIENYCKFYYWTNSAPKWKQKVAQESPSTSQQDGEEIELALLALDRHSRTCTLIKVSSALWLAGGGGGRARRGRRLHAGAGGMPCQDPAAREEEGGRVSNLRRERGEREGVTGGRER